MVLLLFVTKVASGQESVKRLRSPANVKGLIGGESHNSYVIHLRKEQVVTVQISWRHEVVEDIANHAEFYLGELPDFAGEQVKFGTESKNGTRWSGTIPKTGDYYIYVMAHPWADYILRVTTK
jgi:hypothetical protein